MSRKGKKRERKYEENDPNLEYYYIYCEGTKTEPYYFEGLKQYVNSKIGVDKVKIEINPVGRNTESLVEYAIENSKKLANYTDNIWVIFDKDDFMNKQFNDAIFLAESNNLKVGWSNECFEIWIINHFAYIDSAVSREVYYKKLDKIFNELGHESYEKNNKELFNITLEKGNIDFAIKNSKKQINNFIDERSYSLMKPATKVYLLIEEIFERLK